MKLNPASFTIKSNKGILRVLYTDIGLFVPNSTKSLKIQAIWDTGATSSVITQKVVDELGLVPTGMVEVSTANGNVRQHTYIVDIVLPNRIKATDVTVACVDALSGPIDALIGMDIITLGDFSITNHNGTTCMSFRIPSSHEVDYVNGIGFQKPNINIKPGTPGSNRTLPKKKRRK